MISAVDLPCSKSVSNRLLMLQHLYFPSLRIIGLSEADDTMLLKNILDQVSPAACTGADALDVGNCGTAFRFLLPYLAGREGRWCLVGHPRMAERPIIPLLRVLEMWGADIEVLSGSTFAGGLCSSQSSVPLLLIRGRRLHPRDVGMDLSQSSQFLSALMMVAPAYDSPVTFHFQSGIHSLPYVRMTRMLMLNLGFRVEMDEEKVTVFPYAASATEPPASCIVPADWSAAAFWWVWLSLQPASCRLRVRKVQMDERQADSCVVHLLEPFGVRTLFDGEGALIEKVEVMSHPENFCFDAKDSPDLVPLLIGMCCLKQLPAVLMNVENLQYKESDRLQAMRQNLSSWIDFRMSGNDLILKPLRIPEPPFDFDSHGDHRIAMALALFASIQPQLHLPYREVVSKSYPSFWQQLESLL